MVKWLVLYLKAPAAFKNSWTEENATNTCRESIQNALPSHIYSEYVELSEDEFVESCVLDIMVSRQQRKLEYV